MSLSPNRVVQQATSNPELQRPRYHMRNRHQIRASSLMSVDDSQEASLQQGRDMLFLPTFRIDGVTSASRTVDSERPISPQSAAVEAWLNRRSAPLSVAPVVEGHAIKAPVVEEPLLHHSKLPKTSHSKTPAISRSKSVKDLLSNAATFAWRERSAGDVDGQHASSSEQSSNKASQNSPSFIRRLRGSVGRASGRLLQALRAKETQPEETTSDITARQYDTWQGFTRTYTMQSAFTDSFVDSTEVVLDETLLKIRRYTMQEAESAVASPRVPKRAWGVRESVSSESRKDSVHPNASKASPPKAQYRTVR